MADLRELRTILDDAGFNEEAISGMIKRCTTSQGVDLPLLLRATEGPGRLNRLVRLFVLGQALSEEEAKEALKPFPIESLAAVKLLEIGEGREVTSQFCVMPYEKILSLRDFGADWTGRPAMADYVMGVSVSSISLAFITVRKQGEEALDVGTGGGIQAMLAASHAKRVVATDINPRALALAWLGMQINGFVNVDLRLGSMFEPVAGEAFDLIVSQPPFVISPRKVKVFRDSGMPGDSFCEQIVRQAPDYLREGGWCSIMVSWGHRKDDQWSDRPRRWVTGRGCDAWVIRLRVDDVFSYAAQWVKGEGGDASLVDEWMAYYDELGIDEISTGVAVMRKRTAQSNWVRIDALEEHDAKGRCGDQIERFFAAETLLHGLPDRPALLDLRLRLAEDHELQQKLTVADGAWRVEDTCLTHRRGFAFPLHIDRMAAELLSGCDGTRTLREVIEPISRRFSLDAERLAKETLPVVARLMQNGYLTAG